MTDLLKTTEKKNIILSAACQNFAEKGFRQTSISDIAKSAGVVESNIYSFFSGKEGLLFTIPIENTNTLINSLKEHLSGLKGVDIKLRKAIWHYLYFFSQQKDYAKLVLFDLRPNRRFYNSEAYSSFKRYNNIVMDILREGIEEGRFPRRTNINLIRNLIYGGLDHIILSWLLFQKPESLVDQADGLFDIVIKTAKIDEHTELDNKEDVEWTLDKRKIILRVAEEIFAKKGFEKTRISDIAKELKIGEATLYEYFRNKQDILFNIPVERTRNLVDSLMSDLHRDVEEEMKLRLFIRHYLSYLQSNENYMAILIYELRPNRQFYQSEPYKTFVEYNNILIHILKTGQKKRIFRQNANIYLARHMIFGAIDHTALTWLIKGKPYMLSLLAQADELTSLILKGLKH